TLAACHGSEFAAGLDEVGEVYLIGYISERLGIDESVEPDGQLTFRRFGEGLEKHFRDHDAQYAIAEELKPLVVETGDLPGAGMGQCPVEERDVAKALAGALFERFGQFLSLETLPGHPQFIESNSRPGRSSVGHFQISSGLAPPPMEKKMMLARPTRFSAGTKPTEKRLSAELSRL